MIDETLRGQGARPLRLTVVAVAWLVPGVAFAAVESDPV